MAELTLADPLWNSTELKNTAWTSSSTSILCSQTKSVESHQAHSLNSHARWFCWIFHLQCPFHQPLSTPKLWARVTTVGWFCWARLSVRVRVEGLLYFLVFPLVATATLGPFGNLKENQITGWKTAQSLLCQKQGNTKCIDWTLQSDHN